MKFGNLDELLKTYKARGGKEFCPLSSLIRVKRGMERRRPS